MSSSTPIHSESYRLEDVGQIPGTFQLVFDATRYNIIKDERHIVYQILTEFQIKHLAEVRVHPMHVCRSTSLPGLEALLDIDTKLLSYIIGDHPAPQHLEFEEGRLCGICLMPFEEGQQVITTDCSHIFHRGCGLPWMFQTAGAETCPTCRSYLERVYIGFYEKARENMNPEKISVLTGQHHSINKWRIIGLEYQTNEEARFSGARFCKKMFIDNSLWIIVRRIQDGRWVTNSGVKFLAHHPSIPHLTWHCNPKWLAILMSPIRIQLNICRQGDPYLNGALVPIQGITKSGRFQIEAEDFAIGTQIPHHTNQEDNLIR